MTPKEYFVILQERLPLFEWTEYKPPMATSIATKEGERTTPVLKESGFLRFGSGRMGWFKWMQKSKYVDPQKQ
jgi:hypothetical protein